MKVKCTGYNRGERNFTKGKVYEVHDGKITCDDGYTYEDETNEKVIEFLKPWYNFVEVQGHKFKVGDKVKLLDGKNIKYYTGTWVQQMIKHIAKVCTISEVVVINEKPCYRMKEVSFLWDERGLEPVNKNECIVIYRKDNQTIALDERTGKKAVAKCSPDDTYCFEIGAKLAFDRLAGIPPFEEKKPYNGKIIFTKGDWVFKTGHIYEIKDGKLKSPNSGVDLPRAKEYGGGFYSIEDVKDYFTADGERKHKKGWTYKTLEFIEVVDD